MIYKYLFPLFIILSFTSFVLCIPPLSKTINLSFLFFNTISKNSINLALSIPPFSYNLYPIVPVVVIAETIREIGIDIIAKTYYSLCSDDYHIEEDIEKGPNMVACKMSDIVVLKSGSNLTKSQAEKGKYPIYGGGDISGYINQFNRENKIVISKGGMTKNCVRYINGKFFMNAHAWTLDVDTKKVNEKYLYNYLKVHQADIYKMARGLAQQGITQEKFYNFTIVLPSLECQQELYPLLNNLTKQNKSLEEQIKITQECHDNAIKHFLHFHAIKLCKMSDIVVLKPGSKLTKSQAEKGKYPIYGGGDISGYINQFNRENKIVISKGGMSKNCVRYINGKFFMNAHAWTLDVDIKKVNEKYLYYYLKAHQADIYKMARGLAQQGITQKNLYNFTICLPDLINQAELSYFLENGSSETTKFIEGINHKITNNNTLIYDLLHGIIPKDVTIMPKDVTIIPKDVVIMPKDVVIKEFCEDPVITQSRKDIKKFNDMIQNKKKNKVKLAKIVKVV